MMPLHLPSVFCLAFWNNGDKNQFLQIYQEPLDFVLLTNLLLWLSDFVSPLSLVSPVHLYFLLLLLPWIGLDNLLLLLKARSPLENSVTCLSGRISMEDLQSQTSTSMDWLSKFTQTSVRLHCRPLISSASTLSSCVWLNWGFFKKTQSSSCIWLGATKWKCAGFYCTDIRFKSHVSENRTEKHFSCGLNVVITKL